MAYDRVFDDCDECGRRYPLDDLIHTFTETVCVECDGGETADGDADTDGSTLEFPTGDYTNIEQTLTMSPGGLATGDIKIQTADSDYPTVKLAAMTTTELLADATDCRGCDVTPADDGYTSFCAHHRLEALLLMLARGGWR